MMNTSEPSHFYATIGAMFALKGISDMANLPWRMSLRLLSALKKAALVVGILLAVLLAVRVYVSQQGPALQPWHTWHGEEMSAREIDKVSFAEYQAQEQRIFRDMQREVTAKLTPETRTPINRYWGQSLVWPEKFSHNWNHSFVLMPTGEPKGAVVLLHGLTDSPYSVKRLALNYQQHGFVAVVPRLPGHGTAPGALTNVKWEAWLAATRLAVREATRLAGDNVPLHLVGYSNGGALAMKYALDALSDPALRHPQQIVLLSPMMGVTAFARFAGLAGLPAMLPAFAKSAWLNISPEYNPFKYNSFPVNAARQSWLLTQSLQQEMSEAVRRNQLKGLAPVLTFQSIMDSTVSARAVVNTLYNALPANGSELVIVDINQAASFRPLFRPATYYAVNALLPPAPRRYTTTVITNASPATLETVARTTVAGEQSERVSPMAIPYPADLFSLSHVAIPFPPTDDLYGSQPLHPRRYGINLGTLSLRGETSVLVVNMDSLMRVTSNPFFDDMVTRINQHLPPISPGTDKP